MRMDVRMRLKERMRGERVSMEAAKPKPTNFPLLILYYSITKKAKKSSLYAMHATSSTGIYKKKSKIRWKNKSDSYIVLAIHTYD